MFYKFEFIIALRYLKAKKKQKFLSVISGFSLFGIAIGVAALIVVMSVMNGFRKDITEKIIGFNGELSISSYNNTLENFNETLQTIQSNPEVTFAYPVIEKEVLASNKKKTSGAIIKALTREDLEKKKIIFNKVVQGSSEKFALQEGVIIGYELAYRLGIYSGNDITLISPEGTVNTLIGMIPRMKTYKVLGLFASGMYQYDNSTIIMPLQDAQTFFRLNNKISTIEAHIKNPLNSSLVMKNLNATFKENYKIIDWQTANQSFFKVLEVEKVVMFFILSLIIIVAAFNIISSLIMLVKDKTNDIAILNTLGASRASIMRIFFFTGSIIGIFGTILGIIIGIILSLNINTIKVFLEKITATRLFDPIIYYLSNLPSDLQLNNIILIGSLSICLSFIATLYPAYSAAKTNPLEALRYE